MRNKKKTVDGVTMEDVENLADNLRLSVTIGDANSCQKDGCTIEYRGMLRGVITDRTGNEKASIYSDDELEIVGMLYRKLEVLKQTMPVEPEETPPFAAQNLVDRILEAALARGEWHGPPR